MLDVGGPVTAVLPMSSQSVAGLSCATGRLCSPSVERGSFAGLCHERANCEGCGEALLTGEAAEEALPWSGVAVSELSVGMPLVCVVCSQPAGCIHSAGFGIVGCCGDG